MHDTKITCKSIRKRNNLIDNEQNQTLQITNKDMKMFNLTYTEIQNQRVMKYYFSLRLANI